MKGENMCNLIMMTFDSLGEASQIQHTLRQLKGNSSLNFDAEIVCKDKEGNVQTFLMSEMDSNDTPSRRVFDRVAGDRRLLQGLLDSLPSGNSALFVVGEDTSQSALLTLLMLFAPRATAIALPVTSAQDGPADEYLRTNVEIYQAAVANLDALDADTSDNDVEKLYEAVDIAY